MIGNNVAWSSRTGQGWKYFTLRYFTGKGQAFDIFACRAD